MDIKVDRETNARRRNVSRMSTWLIVALVMLSVSSVFGPEGGGWANILLAIWKLSLVAIAAYAGYWIDRKLFPYARPDDHSAEPRVFAACQIRRAIIVGACMLTVGMAL